jgi:hypothetical protein
VEGLQAERHRRPHGGSVSDTVTLTGGVGDSGHVRPTPENADLVAFWVREDDPWLFALSHISARGAERLDSRDLLVAFTPNWADVDMDPVLHRLLLGDRGEDETQARKRHARLRHPEHFVLLLNIPSEHGPPELRDPTGIVAIDANLSKHCAHEDSR